MRQVKILSPVDGYEVGETPVVFGPRGREMIAAGQAVWADNAESTKGPAEPRTQPITSPVTRPVTEEVPKAKTRRPRKAG